VRSGLILVAFPASTLPDDSLQLAPRSGSTLFFEFEIPVDVGVELVEVVFRVKAGLAAGSVQIGTTASPAPNYAATPGSFTGFGSPLGLSDPDLGIATSATLLNEPAGSDRYVIEIVNTLTNTWNTIDAGPVDRWRVDFSGLDALAPYTFMLESISSSPGYDDALKYVDASPDKTTPNAILDLSALNGEVSVVPGGGALGLSLLESSTPQRPLFRNLEGEIGGLDIVGDYALVAAGSAGLAVVNVANPGLPGIPSYVATGGTAFDVASITVGGNDYALVATGTGGLVVVGLSPLTTLATVPSATLGGNVLAVDAVGSQACVVLDTSEIAELDLSDPAAPTVGITVATPGEPQDVALANLGGVDRAVVADGPRGLTIVNLDDGSYHSRDTVSARAVSVEGTRAYVASEDSGLAVVNVFDPSNMGVPTFAYIPGGATGVAVSGNTAYMAAGENGLVTVDVSDISNLGSPQYFDTGVAAGVMVAGSHVFVSGERNDLVIGLAPFRLQFEPSTAAGWTQTYTTAGAHPSAPTDFQGAADSAAAADAGTWPMGFDQTGTVDGDVGFYDLSLWHSDASGAESQRVTKTIFVTPEEYAYFPRVRGVPFDSEVPEMDGNIKGDPGWRGAFSSTFNNGTDDDVVFTAIRSNTGPELFIGVEVFGNPLDDEDRLILGIRGATADRGSTDPIHLASDRVVIIDPEDSTSSGVTWRRPGRERILARSRDSSGSSPGPGESRPWRCLE
jgi:hypothetical protein